jgi:hypothetical protein
MCCRQMRDERTRTIDFGTRSSDVVANTAEGRRSFSSEDLVPAFRRYLNLGKL